MIEQEIKQFQIYGPYRSIEMTIDQIHVDELGNRKSLRFVTHTYEPEDDISHMPKDFRDVANAVWTEEVKQIRQEYLLKFPNQKNTIIKEHGFGEMPEIEGVEANNSVATVFEVEIHKTDLDNWRGYVWNQPTEDNIGYMSFANTSTLFEGEYIPSDEPEEEDEPPEEVE